MKEQQFASTILPGEKWHRMVLALILVVSFATRMFDLTDPPLEYAPSRQLRSAIIARGIYFRLLPEAPAWQREVAFRGQSSQEMLEPELLENLTALTYLLAGGEYLWIPRIYSSLFWTLGGLALYVLMRKYLSADGALIGLLFYLFDPFALLASRTFQPDPLMTAAIVLAWLSFLTWRQENTFRWAVWAGLAAGAAILIKTTAAFFLFFGMAAVLLAENKAQDLIRDLKVWLTAALAAIPALLYHIYGYFISGELRGQLSGRLFNPALWDQPGFYLGWLDTAGKVLGHEIILGLALAGLLLVSGRLRTFLLGTWLGFVVYGFAVSYYVTTHSYYLLPVIPLAAVSLGALGDWLGSLLLKRRLAWLVRAGLAAILLLGAAGGYYLYSRDDYRHEPGYYQKVASFVSPDDRIIALSQDYGYRLAYFGWRTVQPWQGLEKLVEPGSSVETQESYSRQFSNAMAGFDYFIITRMGDFREDARLAGELDGVYRLVQEGGGYRIYDLQERLD